MEYELDNEKRGKTYEDLLSFRNVCQKKFSNFLLSKFFTLFSGLEKTFDLCSKQV